MSLAARRAGAAASEIREALALVPVLLDPPAVFDIAVSADLREIEDLMKLYCGADRGDHMLVTTLW